MEVKRWLKEKNVVDRIQTAEIRCLRKLKGCDRRHKCRYEDSLREMNVTESVNGKC
jgi:hypothetical protein